MTLETFLSIAIPTVAILVTFAFGYIQLSRQSRKTADDIAAWRAEISTRVDTLEKNQTLHEDHCGDRNARIFSRLDDQTEQLGYIRGLLEGSKTNS